MPMFDVYRNSLLGNPVDGYEVNYRRQLKPVYIRPSAVADENELYAALEVLGLIDSADTVDIVDIDHGFELSVLEIAFVDENEDFIEMVPEDPRARARRREQLLRSHDVVEEYGGPAPHVEIELQGMEPDESERFWRSGDASEDKWTGARAAMRVNAYFNDEERVVLETTDGGKNEDFFFHDLGKVLEAEGSLKVGYDPVSEDLIKLDAKELKSLKVALDAFMESGESV